MMANWGLLFGCASKSLKPDAALQPPPSKIVREETKPQEVSGDQIIVSENQKYKIISTPFGPFKQKIIESETGPSGSSTAEPVHIRGKDHKTEASRENVSKGKETISNQDRFGTNKTPETNKEENTSSLVLNFEDADLYEVIRTFAELLEINYIVDPGVTGKVTIHTAGNLDKSDLNAIFFQILEVNGFTAVKDGQLYRITRMKDASRLPILSRYGRQISDIAPGERVIMQIIPLQYVDAGEMVKILTPFISADGTIISHGTSNTLLVVDKGINIVKVLRLVEVFDADIFEQTAHRFFFLTYSEPEELIKILGEILSSQGKPGQETHKLIAIDRLNAILAISKDEAVFERIDSFIKTFDIPSDVAQKRIFIYSVKNGKADELASLLNEIFGTQENQAGDLSGTEDGDKKTEGKPPSNPFAKVTQKSETKERKTPAGGVDIESGTLRDEIKITPDEIRNALIIEATQNDYKVVENILHKLDVLPRQVLIEVMVAEVTLDDETQLGVEWDYIRGDGSPGTEVLSASMGSTGLQYVVGQTRRWNARLSAMASENKVNLLSSPSVLASDNKEAKIDITTEFPVVSSTTTSITSDNPVESTSVEYRDTGIILSVTPHINENGLVSMEISQEVSETAGDKIIAGINYPTFFKRSVTTNLVVKHNQTIVIGGLIKENVSGGTSGVPILSKMPGLGFLFGSDTNKKNKTELILLITPRVISNLHDVDFITEEFQNKVMQTRSITKFRSLLN